MVVFMLSPDDTFDQLSISPTTRLHADRGQLLRLDGIGDIQISARAIIRMPALARSRQDHDARHDRRRRAGGIGAQNLQITGGQFASPPIADRGSSRTSPSPAA